MRSNRWINPETWRADGSAGGIGAWPNLPSGPGLYGYGYAGYRVIPSYDFRCRCAGRGCGVDLSRRAAPAWPGRFREFRLEGARR